MKIVVRVLRGGSYYDVPRLLRNSTSRSGDTPENRGRGIGFRLIIRRKV